MEHNQPTKYGGYIRASGAYDFSYEQGSDEILGAALSRMVDRLFRPWNLTDPNWAARIDWDLLVAPTYTNLTAIPHKVRQYVNRKRVALSDWIYPRGMEF